MKRTIRLSLFASAFLMFAIAAGAQDSPLSLRINADGKEPETPLLQGWGRWSLKVNAVDFLLTVPNLGIEFDLNNTKYSRNTISLTGRFNWNEPHSIKPYNVLNIFEIRPEFRQYCRGLEKRKCILYWGCYADAGTYSIKFSEKGHQGRMCGCGFSFGFVTPVSEYRKFAIDLEVGLLGGLILAADNQYVRSEDHKAYLSLPDESINPLFIPYPVVTEIRVAFVFRKVSCRDRYQLTADQRDSKRQKKIRRENSKTSE